MSTDFHTLSSMANYCYTITNIKRIELAMHYKPRAIMNEIFQEWIALGDHLWKLCNLWQRTLETVSNIMAWKSSMLQKGCFNFWRWLLIFRCACMFWQGNPFTKYMRTHKRMREGRGREGSGKNISPVEGHASSSCVSEKSPEHVYRSNMCSACHFCSST